MTYLPSERFYITNLVGQVIELGTLKADDAYKSSLKKSIN